MHFSFCKVHEFKDHKDTLLERVNHKTREYTKMKICHACHRKHHQSDCDSYLHQAEPCTPQEYPPLLQVFLSMTLTNKGGKTVLLLTTRAIATNDKPRSSTRVRILFDSY